MEGRMNAWEWGGGGGGLAGLGETLPLLEFVQLSKKGETCRRKCPGLTATDRDNF